MSRMRRQGQHAGLTREQVVGAAVALVDTGGAAALSMRRLAVDLGVEAMALYHHVANKSELEDAIVEEVLQGALHDPDPDATWQRLVTSYARDLHQALSRHPGAVPLFVDRPALTTRNVSMLEGLLERICAAGADPRRALGIVHTVAAAVIGQHLAELAPPGKDGPTAELQAATTQSAPLLAAAMTGSPVNVSERVELMLAAFEAGLSVD